MGVAMTYKPQPKPHSLVVGRIYRFVSGDRRVVRLYHLDVEWQYVSGGPIRYCKITDFTRYCRGEVVAA